MQHSTTKYLPTLFLYYLLVVMFLIVFCNSYSLQAENVTKEKPPSAIPNAMAEKSNPNIGKKFPEVKDDSLANTHITLPDAAKGKVTLIVISFLHQNQSQLDSWLEPFVERFGNKEGYTFYEVPMYFSMFTKGTTSSGFIISFSLLVEQEQTQSRPASVSDKMIFCNEQVKTNDENTQKRMIYILLD